MLVNELTIGCLGQRNGLLNRLLLFNNWHATKSEPSPTREVWWALLDVLNVRQPHLESIWLPSLEARHNSPNFGRTNSHEVTGRRSFTSEIENELVVEEEITTTSKRKTKLPWSILVWSEGRGVLSRVGGNNLDGEGGAYAREAPRVDDGRVLAIYQHDGGHVLNRVRTTPSSKTQLDSEVVELQIEGFNSSLGDLER